MHHILSNRAIFEVLVKTMRAPVNINEFWIDRQPLAIACARRPPGRHDTA
jgi:hypothetical protein